MIKSLLNDRSICAVGLIALCCGGCSLQRMAAKQTATMLGDAMPVFEGESDYELAAQAFPASLKTMEGILRSVPGNRDLLLLLARGYAAYALVVVEDAMERAEAAEDEAEGEHQRLRAKSLYLRASRYGVRLLEQRVPGFGAAFEARSASLYKRYLPGCEKGDVPGLFWAGMALASAINVARDDVMLVGELSLARALLERAAALDEGYYYGGAHLALGALLGSSGPMTGGDTKGSQRHFERALELSGRRFLLAQEMYARTLAVQLQDRKRFDALLSEVVEAPLSTNPQQKLANQAAKRRARRMQGRVDELF